MPARLYKLKLGDAGKFEGAYNHLLPQVEGIAENPAAHKYRWIKIFKHSLLTFLLFDV